MPIQEDFLARESKLSSQLVELRDTQSRSQQKLEMKQKELSDKRQQMTETSRQLKKIGSSGAVIDQIELELRKDVRNTHTLLTDHIYLSRNKSCQSTDPVSVSQQWSKSCRLSTARRSSSIRQCTPYSMR